MVDATVKVVLKAGEQISDGRYSLKLIVTHNRVPRRLSIGQYVTKED